MSATADETAEKQPSERRLFTMDFSAKMSTTETINGTPTVTSENICGAASDLTIETPTVVGQTVQMWISGGTSKQRYRIEVTFTSSIGQVLEGDGIMKVSDK